LIRRWAVACLVAAGCSVPAVQVAEVPDTRADTDAASLRTRSGETDGVMLLHARLRIERDDLSLARVEPSRDEGEVILERSVSESMGSPVVTLTVTDVARDDSLRFTRAIAERRIRIERRSGGPSALAKRRIAPDRRIVLIDLLDPSHPLPP
jgi:hypothetical protein